MAVRLVMGDVDERYLAQMQGFLEKNYPSEAEIHSFTNADSLEDFVKREGADVVLINPRLGIGVKRLYRAGAVAVAYLDEKDGAPDVTGERIVGKYKRPDVFLGIVKEIADEGAARARVNARLEADRARQAAEEEARRAAEEEAARAAAERARREEEETAKQFQAGAEIPAGGWDAPSPIPVFGIPSEDDPLDDQKTIAFTSGTDFKGPAAKIIEVTSFSGGTGATTISAALAKNLAARGLKVMYLNLETACSCGSLFQSDDPGSFGNVLKAAFSNEELTAEILMDNLCLSSDGVWFYRPCDDPELMLTLSSDHILELLGGLRYAGMFSHIIVDFNFIASEQDLRILGSADRILILNDGSVTANAKYLQSFRLVQYLEKLTGISVTDRMELIYNRFSSSKSSTTIPDPGISVIGRIPPIKHATTEEIVEYIKTNMNVLKRIS
ncbi:MAG: hypothetical protein IKH70_01650 [Stomatobaculum sp.]|nr:hypothetical protein [Stomatobaculum sp.]